MRSNPFWAFDPLSEWQKWQCSAESASLRRLYSIFAGGWPGTGLLLMRVVVGSALVGSAILKLLSDPPPLNVTIPAILLVGGGIFLIVGLCIPIAGVSVAITEVWKMLMLHGDKSSWLLLGPLVPRSQC